MATWEAWQRHRDRTEVCEKEGKYYLKAYPESLYDTYEEAKEASENMRDLIVF